MTHSTCAMCRKHEYVRPLHGDKGGPLCCILCIGKWHGEHGRRRKLGRIVVRAMNAYLDGGGNYGDLDKLKLSATGSGILSGLGFELDPLGYLDGIADTKDENIDLTSELLVGAIKLAHPDLHPPERRELAHRVTQGLLALQPFTFPASKPKEPKPTPPAPPKPMSDRNAVLKKPRYPCPECACHVPYFYCDACKAEWNRRRDNEEERERARQRDRYKVRKQSRSWRKPASICAACGKNFKGKRADAQFCSATCRQRAHRAVTDKSMDTVNVEIAVT
jgi:hypothetical protein